MSFAFYMRDGKFTYNNRPLNRMGKTGTSKRILDLLGDGSMSLEELASHIKTQPRHVVKRTLKRMAERGLVELNGDKWRAL